MNQSRACDLCGLDIGIKPFYMEVAGKRLQFCCDACLGIYQMLHETEPSTKSDISIPASGAINKDDRS
jgi:ribosome-binding protein aMBF1 (putative translation factor)